MKRIFLAMSLLVLGAGLSHAARADDAFYAACRARPDASEAGCACQTKLADSALTPQEMQWAAVGVSQGGDALKAQLKPLSKPERMQFLKKMRQLGDQAKASCP